MGSRLYTEAFAGKKERAFAKFPAAHKLVPEDLEIVASKEGILRLQNWLCTQGFAAVISHEDTKERQRVTLECTRRGKKTRDTRKNAKKRRRPNNNVSYNKCKWKIYI